MAELAQAQETLKETLDKVATLEAQFDEANTKKVRRTRLSLVLHPEGDVVSTFFIQVHNKL